MLWSCGYCCGDWFSGSSDSYYLGCRCGGCGVGTVAVAVVAAVVIFVIMDPTVALHSFFQWNMNF
jgi:hypothetical protein